MDYLLKSSICLTAFYGLYYFGFRRLTFHAHNRFYLLASLALSLTIPMLNYEREKVVFIEPKPVIERIYSDENISQIPDNQIVTNNISQERTEVFQIDWNLILGVIYLSGMAVMLFVFLRNIAAIVEILAKNNKQNSNLLYTKSHFSNSSFFKYIFINPENLNPHEQSLVIAHESFHAKQLHTLDLLLLGVLKAIFWFNPIIYFYQKSLKQIHEYEVDALMSASHDNQSYAHLLLKLGVVPNSLIINQFSTKPLSDRIQFLFKKPTQNMKKLLYFLVIPILGIGIMAFAQENLKVVYREREGERIFKSVEVKEYPLVINDETNRASWTSDTKIFSFSPTNVSLNKIQIKNYNGFHYLANPNSLTIKMIGEVNKFIGKRFLSLMITEKELDSDGNLTKLGLAIKHLSTNEVTQTEIFDMKDLREKGKNGAFIFIEGYDKNFKESQMSINYGTKDLAITKSSYKNLHSFVAYDVNTEGTSAIKHSNDKITYCVFPGRVSQQTLQEAQAYFAKNGFDLKVNSFKNGKNNQFESIDLSFGNVSKVFIINDLKHLVKLKSEKNGKFHRTDESIIFEADTKTLETKIFVENRMFKMFEKSDKWEIKDVVMNEIHTQIDSSRFSFKLDFAINLSKIDSFVVSANDILLVKNKDFIVKGKEVYFEEMFRKSKIKIHLYFSTSGGNLLYPQLAKLEERAFPKVNSVSNLPLAFLKKDSVNFPTRGIKENRKFIY